MADQQIQCCDCPTVFSFTQGEADFYAEKQLTPPRRCKPCREKKKQRREGAQQRGMQQGHGGYGNHQVPGVHEENVPMDGAADFL